jgi:hypothetical protein
VRSADRAFRLKVEATSRIQTSERWHAYAQMTAGATPLSIIIPLRSRRRDRGLLLQKLQHAIPAIPLLFQGLGTLRTEAHGFELGLAVAEVVTSAFLVITVVRAMREARQGVAGHRSHSAHGVDWAHIWAAGVLFAEAGERWHLRHHIAIPTILTALLTLGLGGFHGRLAAFGERRRSLRLDEFGVSVPRRPFGTFTVSWKDVIAISVTEREATIRARDGRTRRINLLDLHNATDVRGALAVAEERVRAAALSAKPA